MNETVDQIICQIKHPEIGSHHDLIISSLTLSELPPPAICSDLPKAPRASYDTVRVNWTQDCTETFNFLVSKSLQDLRRMWPVTNSKALTSVFIKCTNDILIEGAKATNIVFPSGQSTKKPKRINTLCYKKS